MDRRGQVAIWMQALTVASLRSPMAPGYMLAGTLAGLALVSAEVRSIRGWVVGAALYAALMSTSPFAPHWMGFALAGQAVVHGSILWLLLRRWPVLDAEHPPRLLGGPVTDHSVARP